MTDYHEQADRMIRGGNVSADAAAIVYAILAVAQGVCSFGTVTVTREQEN